MLEMTEGRSQLFTDICLTFTTIYLAGYECTDLSYDGPVGSSMRQCQTVQQSVRVHTAHVGAISSRVCHLWEVHHRRGDGILYCSYLGMHFYFYLVAWKEGIDYMLALLSSVFPPNASQDSELCTAP